MDTVTPEKRSWIMSRVKSKDTSIELKLRRALWHAGIRYRKNYAKLPGTPDVAITKWRIAVFCDSAFWHGRDFDARRKPKTNTEFWNAKILRTMERDRETDKRLRGMGWTVLRFWDDEINKSLDQCVRAVKETIFELQVVTDDPEYDDDQV